MGHAGREYLGLVLDGTRPKGGGRRDPHRQAQYAGFPATNATTTKSGGLHRGLPAAIPGKCDFDDRGRGEVGGTIRVFTEAAPREAGGSWSMY